MKKRGMKASLWLLLALRNHCFLILHFLYGAQRLEDKLGVVVHACNSSYLRSRSRMIKAPVQPWKSMKPYLKKKQKMAGDKNQVAEHLPSNHKALSSNPRTTKKERKEGRKERERYKERKEERKKDRKEGRKEGRKERRQKDTYPGSQSLGLFCPQTAPLLVRKQYFPLSSCGRASPTWPSLCQSRNCSRSDWISAQSSPGNPGLSREQPTAGEAGRMLDAGIQTTPALPRPNTWAPPALGPAEERPVGPEVAGRSGLGRR
jgi:hypothetical protein